MKRTAWVTLDELIFEVKEKRTRGRRSLCVTFDAPAAITRKDARRVAKLIARLAFRKRAS